MKKWLSVAAVSALAMGMVFGIASAAVSVNSDGTGFVGKGDVQQALGLNNAQLQAAAGSLTFTMHDRVVYEVACQKTVGQGQMTMEKTFDRHRNVNSTVSFDARKMNQITGFNLLGFSNQSAGVDFDRGCPEGWEQDTNPELAAAGFVNGVRTLSSSSALKVNGVPLQ